MNNSISSEFDAATRIAAGATRTRYDSASIALHWTTVALVLMQFLLAEFWGFFARPERHTMIMLHMSFGILLAAVVAIRIVWRFIPGHEMPPATSGWMEIASKFVHGLLYAMLIAQVALGFELRWAGNEAMSFFGLLIPSPFAPLSRSTRHLLGEAHNWLGWAIVIVAAGHALAALYHHFHLRDNVLRRMLPGGALD